MIVRILGEGQFDLPEDRLDEVNELDAELQRAIDGGDDDRFRTALTALLERVRALGAPVGGEVLVGSDLVLPASDANLSDVRGMLNDEGLIPG